MKYNIAIFIDPNEVNSPSNKEALRYFVDAGIELGMNIEVVTLDSMDVLSRYDGLFLRSTPCFNGGAYFLSTIAKKMGLVVIDDPESIYVCGNKSLQHRIFKHNKVSYPWSMSISKMTNTKVLAGIEFPLIVKEPAGSFSKGVFKVGNYEELLDKMSELLPNNRELLLQEYMPTDFDWRIGIIDNKPIYACKYWMAKGHWQIYNWKAADEENIEGNTENIQLDDVPRNVIRLAMKATKFVGNGLYGVDIKVYNDIPYIVEINDNPSIDHNIEDKLLGRELYVSIMKVFKKRIRAQRRLKNG